MILKFYSNCILKTFIRPEILLHCVALINVTMNELTDYADAPHVTMPQNTPLQCLAGKFKATSCSMS